MKRIHKHCTVCIVVYVTSEAKQAETKLPLAGERYVKRRVGYRDTVHSNRVDQKSEIKKSKALLKFLQETHTKCLIVISV